MSDDRFLSLFGVEPSRIKPLCVLLPFSPRIILNSLGVDRLTRGKHYGTGTSGDLTVIRTGMGAFRVGDAVLELAATPARRLILFGACGMLASRDKASPAVPVTARRAFAAESFTDLLRGEPVSRRIYYPDPSFQQELLATEPAVREVTVLSVGSLNLEEENRATWVKAGMEAVDLETAAFFSAARARGRAAVSLLLISDIVGKRPYYRAPSPSEQAELERAVNSGAEVICRLSGRIRG